MTEITDQELYILSFYRACELSGALLFGKLAFHTNIDEYRVQLTEHSLEEANHAWLWTKAIADLGRTPMKVTETYQTYYGKMFGMPENIFEIFCLTQIFEKRTLEVFNKHLEWPSTHPLVKEVLRKMIDDETGHIGWIREELDNYAKEHGQDKLDTTMTKLQDMDNKVYASLLESQPFKDYFKEIL